MLKEEVMRWKTAAGEDKVKSAKSTKSVVVSPEMEEKSTGAWSR